MSLAIIKNLLSFFAENISDEIKNIKINIENDVYYTIDLESNNNIFQIQHLECYKGTYLGQGPSYVIYVLKNDIFQHIKTKYHSGYEFNNGVISEEYITFETK